MQVSAVELAEILRNNNIDRSHVSETWLQEKYSNQGYLKD